MAKLTPAQVTEIYEEIGNMRVDLDADPNKGLQYVKERLTLCRAMQDRLGELQLKAHRSLSQVWQEALTLRMEHELTPSGPLKQRLRVVEAEKQDHDLLVKMIRAQMQLLSRTSMDVRLLADLTKEQLKLGEINPNDADLVKEVSVEDISPVSGNLASMSVAVVGAGADFDKLAAQVEPKNAPAQPGVETVDFNGPSGIMEDDQKPVPQTEPTVNFEDLFGDLHGETAAPRIF